MQTEYQQHGYVLRRDFFTRQELDGIEPAIRRFHDRWLGENQRAYEAGSINSAYLTHSAMMDGPDRAALFAFMASDKLTAAARALITKGPAFLNTQLFFNPCNEAQKNYWHRDIQYTPLSEAEQRAKLASPVALHFRVPLADEPGIELVPGTHERWDSEEEFNTRMGAEGHTPSDDLDSGRTIALRRGDLLVFSANIIHRGLYGGDRFALDIMITEPAPDVLQYADPACLPTAAELASLPNRDVFERTRDALAQIKTGPDT